MSIKSYFNQKPIAFVAFNIVAAFVIILIALLVMHYVLLGSTRHGEQIEVPDVSGMYIEEAQILLEANHLSFQIVDSTYDRTRRLGTVIQQTPIAGSHVKEGREIYLSINAKQVRKVNIPDMRELSYMQARLQLEATGIVVDTVYKESEYNDLVLDMEYNGSSVMPDTWVKEGETVVLIIGRNDNATREDRQAVIPNLIGLPLNIARTTIDNNQFHLGGCVVDQGELDTLQNTYWVYDQEPLPRVASFIGATISIYVTTDPTKAERENKQRLQEEENKAAEEEFF